MGLRAPSGGGLKELTTKQAEMNRSFSPLNNNKQNGLPSEGLMTPQKEGVVKAEDSAKVQETSSGQKNLAAGSRTAQAAVGLPEISGLIGNLGIFNMSLMASVNQFTNSAPASTANTKLLTGGQPVYNETTGQWEAPETSTVEAGVNSLFDEKKAQQDALKNTASGIIDDKGNAKSFEEVLKQFADSNRDGVIDAKEQQWLNESFDIANALRKLKEADPYSAEAQALKAQLAAKDKNGLVSGVLNALDEYDSIVGMKAVGADADTYRLQDLLTMGDDTMKAEIQKALTQSSGLFGADYETYIKREVDKSANQYNQAAREDAVVMQQLKDESTKWLKEFETEFSSAKDQLNKQFRGAASSLIADLNKEASGGNKGIEQAKQWFVDTQTLVDVGSKDFGTVIFQALVDSKLGAEPKAILKKWLGSTIGQDVAEKGVLAYLMDKIGKTGSFWTEDENGQQVQVYFDARQKMNVVRIANDPNMTDGQKSDAIQGIIDSASKGMGTRLNQDLGKVLEPIQSGNLEKGLNVWRGAMTKSMTGFEDSLIQAGYTAAVDSMGRNNDPAVMQAAVEQKAQQKIEEINKAMLETQAAIDKLQKNVTSDISGIDANIKMAEDLTQKGIQSIKTNYTNALADYMKQLTSPQYGSKIGETAATYLQSLWTNSMKGAAMPADLNEKYGKAFAAARMAKNMKGTSDETLKNAYTILVRDYLGGDASLIDGLDQQLGSIFTDPKYLGAASNIARAFSSDDFARAVWDTTRNGKAVEAKVKSNSEARKAAAAKLAESETSLEEMQKVYNETLDKLGQTAEYASQKARQKALANPAPARSPTPFFQEELRPGEQRAENGATYVVGENGTKYLTGWSSQAIDEHIAKFGFDPREPLQPYKREFDPITADTSQQTANNLFNQALEGQTMDFTRNPNVDLEALRKLGNIQYTPTANGGQVGGLEQYVTPEWTPAGSVIATSQPINNVGGGTPQPAKALEPAQVQAALQNTSKEERDRVRVKVATDPNTKTVGIDPKTGGLVVVAKGSPNAIGEGYANSVILGGLTDGAGNIVATDPSGNPLGPTSPYAPRGQGPSPAGQPAGKNINDITTSKEAAKEAASAEQQLAAAQKNLADLTQKKQQEKQNSPLTPDKVIDFKYYDRIAEAEKAVEQAAEYLAKVNDKERELTSEEYAAAEEAKKKPTKTPGDGGSDRRTPQPKGGIHDPGNKNWGKDNIGGGSSNVA